MMTVNKISRIVTEIHSFLDAANQVQHLHLQDAHKDRRLPPSKETAALRRASMDLTRALADLRRSG